MPTFTPAKALRDFVKTPVILNAILRGVDQARAQEATDGADGWSVLEVVCHMSDFEQIFYERALSMLNEDQPKFPRYDPDELADTNAYAHQSFDLIFSTYLSRRRAFVALLRGLAPEQWQRTGIHPDSGIMTVVELAINTTLHDVNHIEQIVKALGTSPDLAAL